VTDTNDLNAAFRRIADDLAAYYLLGYYTTNTRFDGGLRKITVRLKSDRPRGDQGGQGDPRAARVSRADRSGDRRDVRRARGATRSAGPAAVIGEAAAFRVSRAQPPERVKLLEFVRSDRLRAEWPVLAPLDRREARLLDSAGKPMAFDLPYRKRPTARRSSSNCCWRRSAAARIRSSSPRRPAARPSSAA
jgi:hypothetical protein